MLDEPSPIESDFLRPARARPPADTLVIDLNADVGEGSAAEFKIIPYVSSVNVACGGHAGDAGLMRRVMNYALQHGVAIGAHPGYEDRENMGRKPLDLPADVLKDQLQRQLTLFRTTLRSAGGKWQHVKLHGALYHQAAEERQVAETVLDVLGELCPNAYLFCQPRGLLYQLAGETGRRVVPEYFADRGYQQDGTLIPRGEPEALLSIPDRVIANVERLAREYYAGLGTQGVVVNAEASLAALDLFALPAPSHHPPASLHPTFCLHSDTPNVIEVARWLRIGLSRAHIDVASYPRV